MGNVHSLAAIVLAVSVGVAAVPAFAGQPATTPRTPKNGMGMTMGRTGHGMMGGSMIGGGMMGNGTMGRGMSDGSMMDRGMMNGGRPNSQWRGPQSPPQGMPG